MTKEERTHIIKSRGLQAVQATPKLQQSAKRVYRAAFNRQGPKLRRGIPDRWLTEDTGLHRRSIMRARTKLVEFGLVLIEKRGQRGFRYCFATNPKEVLAGSKPEWPGSTPDAATHWRPPTVTECHSGRASTVTECHRTLTSSSLTSSPLTGAGRKTAKPPSSAKPKRQTARKRPAQRTSDAHDNARNDTPARKPQPEPKSKRKRPAKQKARPAKHGTEVHRLYAAWCERVKARYGANPDGRTGAKIRGKMDRLIEAGLELDGRKPRWDFIDVGKGIADWWQQDRRDHDWEFFESRFRQSVGKMGAAPEEDPLSEACGRKLAAEAAKEAAP